MTKECTCSCILQEDLDMGLSVCIFSPQQFSPLPLRARRCSFLRYIPSWFPELFPAQSSWSIFIRTCKRRKGSWPSDSSLSILKFSGSCHSFIHCQHICAENLPCSSHYVRHCGYTDEQNRCKPLPHRIYTLMGGYDNIYSHISHSGVYI